MLAAATTDRVRNARVDRDRAESETTLVLAALTRPEIADAALLIFDIDSTG